MRVHCILTKRRHISHCQYIHRIILIYFYARLEIIIQSADSRLMKDERIRGGGGNTDHRRRLCRGLFRRCASTRARRPWGRHPGLAAAAVPICARRTTETTTRPLLAVDIFFTIREIFTISRLIRRHSCHRPGVPTQRVDAANSTVRRRAHAQCERPRTSRLRRSTCRNSLRIAVTRIELIKSNLTASFLQLRTLQNLLLPISYK